MSFIRLFSLFAAFGSSHPSQQTACPASAASLALENKMDFQEAATHGTVLATIKPVHNTPSNNIPCAACNTNLVNHTLALAPQKTTHTNKTTQNLYCQKCYPHNLGPPCRKCNKPAPRKNAVLAADSWWHRECFNCAACGVGLGDEYHVHEGAAESSTLRAAEPGA